MSPTENTRNMRDGSNGAELARFGGAGVGQSGNNPDYVKNTYAHLVELAISRRDSGMLARELG